MQVATPENKQAACAWLVTWTKGDNQTRMDLPFHKAFGLAGLDTVVLLTDGYPYKGKRRIPANTILDLVEARNRSVQARIATFGFAKANHSLLAELARRSGGSYRRLD